MPKSFALSLLKGGEGSTYLQLQRRGGTFPYAPG